MNWLPKQSVVVPVDFSTQSLEAVRIALTMVDHPECLHVVNVLEPMPFMEPGVVWNEVTDTTRIRHTTEALRKRLDEINVGGVLIEVRIGSPGVEIADYAKSIDTDLIVIPSHGYTGLKHMLLGSVAERVSRLASCPVLILRCACEEKKSKQA